MGGQAVVLPGRLRVSVVIPCLNEERFIGATLDSLLDGSFPSEEMEILVVDGRSQDRTRAVICERAYRDARVRLLDNRRGTTPAALNHGIRAARGEIIIRADAHSRYPADYVATLVRTLERTGADMVGPCMEFVPADDSLVCRAITLALASPFATGARFRYRRESGPVDAVQLGCWRRTVFERVGLFDERLLRNQDNEHSARILRAGGRVEMTAEVSIAYHPRPRLRALWRHGTANGMWNAFTERLYPYTFRWRHALPGVFFLGVLLAAGLLVAGRGAWPSVAALLVLAPYAAANLLAAVAIGQRHHRYGWVPLFGFVLWTYHLAYGYGVTKGWLLVLTGAWRSRLGGGSREARLT